MGASRQIVIGLTTATVAVEAAVAWRGVSGSDSGGDDENLFFSCSVDFPPAIPAIAANHNKCMLGK